MTRQNKIFTNWNHLLIFCALGFFWVTNIGLLLETKKILMRLFVFPVSVAFLPIFLYLLLKLKDKRSLFDKPSYILLNILILLGILCISRGLSLTPSFDSIKILLVGRAGAAIIWLMPLSILFSIESSFWFRYLPKIRELVFWGIVFVLLILLFIIITGTFPEKKMYNSCDFLFLSTFLIILSRYKLDSVNLMLGFIGIVCLSAFMFILHERFAIAYIGLISLLSLLSFFFEKYRLDLKFRLFSAFCFFSILVACILLYIPFFRPYTDHYIFQKELFVDTRGEGTLAKAVTEDMTMFEKITGKGSDGLYIWGARGWPPQPYIRSNVEMGYMQLILKGGYLMLVIFLCLTLYAVYLGVFRSNNRLTRYLAYIIVARLIIMLTAMIPRVGFEYFMFWLVVGGCLSKQLRSLSDKEIIDNFNFKRIIIRW
jgi:hypothetical protein